LTAFLVQSGTKKAIADCLYFSFCKCDLLLPICATL